MFLLSVLFVYYDLPRKCTSNSALRTIEYTLYTDHALYCTLNSTISSQSIFVPRSLLRVSWTITITVAIGSSLIGLRLAGIHTLLIGIRD